MAPHVTHPVPRGALGIVAIVLLVVAAAGTTLDAQRRSASATRSALKGIWEPVSYPEDVHLNGVFFVNPDVGWVTSGTVHEGGMLLRTRDGGASWEVQLGDHESEDPPFRSPYFLDEMVGWVLQPTNIGKFKLLRTTDGESWQQVGAIQTDWGLQDYVFTSKNVGIYVDGNDNQARIVRTTDGGRTWKDVFHCRAKIVVDGLSRDVACTLKALHFPTAEVGYAIGGAHGAKRILFVAKTEDGGNRWALTVVPDVGGDLEVYHDQELFFTDANTGFAHLAESRLYSTTDGGQTWNGLVGTPGSDIKFADPEVGWSFAGARLTYTTDGGKRWSSRELSFPAKVNDFSLPRRNRGYVVGEHGMIFRYTVVPEAEPTAASVVEAPAMPTFESPLDDQVATAEQQVETLEAQIESAASSAADTAVIIDACCVQTVNNLQSTVDALTPLVPQFLRKYRNVNLILAGLQFLGILPDHLAQVKTALKTLRQARGPTATAAALTQLSTAIDALSATTRQAFQKDPMQYGGADAGLLPSSSAAAAATMPSDATADVPSTDAASSDSTAVSETEAEAKRKVAEEAKKRAKDELKKRVKIRFP
jgi:photosystem II stability/assembly factor-like uncharacterized protein